jgi:hypothetical protein
MDMEALNAVLSNRVQLSANLNFSKLNIILLSTVADFLLGCVANPKSWIY